MNIFVKKQKCSLGRGFGNRSRENPGIAKKKGGGSDPCQDFFGGFVVQRVVEVLVTRLKHAICQCSEMYRCMERQFP